MPAGPAGGSADASVSLGLGAGYGFFETDVAFASLPGDVEMKAHMVVATARTQLSPDWSLSGLLGAVMGGQLRLPSTGQRYGFGPGAVLGIAFEREWLPQTAISPFLSTSFKLAASYTPAVNNTAETLLAIDLRAAVTVGKTIAGVVTPYLSVRVFGGPVVWLRESQTLWGSDNYHAQLAMGTTVRLPIGVNRALSVSFDVSPLLERSVSVSVNLDL